MRASKSLYAVRLTRRFAIGCPRLTYVLVAVVPIVLRLSLLWSFSIPQPRVHDEFSYLLGADTIASGRLSNPTHPLWIYFETFHVNQQPTYATKYLPGQSLMLALGQTVLGHPWCGVLISVSLMCVCFYWMLQGWLPPPYPLLGSLLAGVQFGIANYWGNSYWGGALPAAGGALVAGSLPRLARRARRSEALFGSIGATVLAFTRPYEGLILTLASFVILIWWRRRERRPIRLLFAPDIILPAAVVLGLALSWLGYYNYRVTGKYWLLSYSVNQSTYAANPVLWILPRGPVPTYRHQALRTFWESYLRSYEQVRENPLRILKDFRGIMTFFLPAPLLLAAVVAVLFALTPKVMSALVISASVAVALLFEVALLPHYYAPAACLILFLVLSGARYLIQIGLRYPRLGDFTFLIISVVTLFGVTLKAVEVMQRPREEDFAVHRQEIMERLAKSGSHHLVVVRYSPEHNVGEEWVYNRANIDSADIVWARDMGESGNQPLLEYYKDRKIWLLQPDVSPPILVDYASSIRKKSTLPNERTRASLGAH